MQSSELALPPGLERQLDNPVWASLRSRHAHLAVGDALARRYPSFISPLTGLSGDGPEHLAALESLISIGDDTAIVGPFVPKLSPSWEVLYESNLTQMIRFDRSSLPEGNIEAKALSSSDVDEMLALVELTHPGPFRRRTIELGQFLGVRDGGRLVAMSGERMWIGDCRELSAVCTHPDAQRRGYARALIGRVINRMLRTGQTPFLHLESHNARAIDLYRSLGFAARTGFPLLYARRVAS